MITMRRSFTHPKTADPSGDSYPQQSGHVELTLIQTNCKKSRWAETDNDLLCTSTRGVGKTSLTLQPDTCRDVVTLTKQQNLPCCFSWCTHKHLRTNFISSRNRAQPGFFRIIYTYFTLKFHTNVTTSIIVRRTRYDAYTTILFRVSVCDNGKHTEHQRRRKRTTECSSSCGPMLKSYVGRLR